MITEEYNELFVKICDGLIDAGFKAELKDSYNKDAKEITIKTIYGTHDIRRPIKDGQNIRMSINWSLSSFAKDRGLVDRDDSSNIPVDINDDTLNRLVQILGEILDFHEKAIEELNKTFPEAKTIKRPSHYGSYETFGLKITKKKAVSLSLFPHMGTVEVLWRLMQPNGGSTVEHRTLKMPLDSSEVQKIRQRFDDIAVVDIQKKEATLTEKTARSILAGMAKKIGGDRTKIGVLTVGAEKLCTLKIDCWIPRLGQYKFHVNIQKDHFVIRIETPTKSEKKGKILIANPNSVDLVLARCDEYYKMISKLEEIAENMKEMMDEVESHSAK